MKVHRRLIVLAASVAGLVSAVSAPAFGATAFTAGVGDAADVAVSPNGNGHVVWVDAADPTPHRVGYCRVAPGGTSCAQSATLNFNAGSGSFALNTQPQVFALSDTKIVVLASCFSCGGGAGDRTYRWISTDGGQTWPASPTYLGGFREGQSSGEYLDGADPAAQFIGISGTQLLAMDQATTPSTPIQVLPSGYVYEPSVVRVPGTNQLVAAATNLDDLRFGVYTGSDLATASIDTAAKWEINKVPDADEPDDVWYPRLTAGPAGVFLTYRYFVPNDDRIRLRRYDPATRTMGAPTEIQGSAAIDDSADYPSSFQDASGRLHVVWRSLYNNGRLRYTTSTDGGVTWSAPANLASTEDFIEPEVSANAAGQGFAVWTGIGHSNIRVVALDPQPEPAPAPTPTPTPSPVPTPTPPAKTAPATKTVTVAGAKITFGVPGACVSPGQTFQVTLTWKKQKRKGSKFVKVRRADFYIGAIRKKIDRKAPFRQTLRVTATAKPGATITLRARAFIKVKRGKSPTKSIVARIRVCG